MRRFSVRCVHARHGKTYLGLEFSEFFELQRGGARVADVRPRVVHKPVALVEDLAFLLHAGAPFGDLGPDIARVREARTVLELRTNEETVLLRERAP